MYNIDTSLIQRAMDFYSTLGYEPVAVPMIIDKNVSDITKPEGRGELQHLDGVYVASAEQSFLQMIQDDSLPYGEYMAITPCYRTEEVIDESHLCIFLKIELVSYKQEIPDDTTYILRDVCHFLDCVTPDYAVVGTEEGQDIEIGGVEVGSYGYRTVKGGVLLYGTGIAEPRLSYALSKVK